MPTIVIPETLEKINRLIAAMKYQIEHDTREKDRQIHKAALDDLITARQEMIEGDKEKSACVASTDGPK